MMFIDWIASRRRFDRLSRKQLEALVETLTEQRATQDRNLQAANSRVLTTADECAEHRRELARRLRDRAAAHELDAQHLLRGTPTPDQKDRAVRHRAVAHELLDAARDCGLEDAPVASTARPQSTEGATQ